MKRIKNIIPLSKILLSGYSAASDAVPFSVKRIKPVGAGYFELVGPGEIKTKKDRSLRRHKIH